MAFLVVCEPYAASFHYQHGIGNTCARRYDSQPSGTTVRPTHSVRTIGAVMSSKVQPLLRPRRSPKMAAHASAVEKPAHARAQTFGTHSLREHSDYDFARQFETKVSHELSFNCNSRSLRTTFFTSLGLRTKSEDRSDEPSRFKVFSNESSLPKSLLTSWSPNALFSVGLPCFRFSDSLSDLQSSSSPLVVKAWFSHSANTNLRCEVLKLARLLRSVASRPSPFEFLSSSSFTRSLDLNALLILRQS